MSVISLYPCDFGTGTPHQGYHHFEASEYGVVCRLCGKPAPSQDGAE